jgi:phosphotriesterase-related protein
VSDEASWRTSRQEYFQMEQINTVTGTVSPDKLGVTLMHEHLCVGWGGWELDCSVPKFDHKAALKKCVEQMKQLKDLGLQTFVEAAPMDLGRNVTLAAEVAAASGVNIICATGLYKEDLGSPSYFRERSADEVAEVFVIEITKGIGETGIKAGIIKCATSAGRIPPYEEKCLRAAARAHRRTGVPITTHTDEGTMGREQLEIFASEGVDLKHVIVGHSCGSSDLGYHTDMLNRGCYLGFDRFGLDILHPDRLRTAALIALLGIGLERQIVLSHDSVACWLGRGPEITAEMLKLVANWNPTHIFNNIIPALRKAGVPQEKIDVMMVENPRRFFRG